MDDGASRRIAGVHEVFPLFVGALGGAERADEGDFVGVFGQQREAVAELDSIGIGGDGLDGSADVGRRVGFGIEGVDVGHAAGHVEVDDMFRLAATGLEHGGVGGERGVVEKPGHRSADGEAEAGAGGAAEEIAAVELVEAVRVHEEDISYWMKMKRLDVSMAEARSRKVELPWLWRDSVPFPAASGVRRRG